MKFNNPLTQIAKAGVTSVFALALFSGLITNANAVTVYKYAGKKGEVVYAQYQPRGVKNVEVIEFRSDGRVTEAGQMAGKVDPNQEDKRPTPQEQRIAQLEKQTKELQAREQAERCQSLRNNLTKLNSGERIISRDAEGKKFYLDDRQMQAEREKQEKLFNKYCSSPA